MRSLYFISCFILLLNVLFILPAVSQSQPSISLGHAVTFAGFNGYKNKITVVYTFKNTGTSRLDNVVLTDNYVQMFGTEAISGSFVLNVTTPAVGGGIAKNNAYQGGADNLLQPASFLNPGDEAKLTLTFEVELTSQYKGNQFNSNARMLCDGFIYPILSIAALNLCQITIAKVNNNNTVQTGNASVSTAEKNEETLVFSITRKGMTTKETHINYVIDPSAARPTANRADMNDDITFISPLSGTIIFPKDNTLPQTISIKIKNDNIYELLEYFTLTLNPVTGYNEASILQRKVETEILSDDSTPVVTVEQIGPATVIEGSQGDALSTKVPIRISISNPSYLQITVNWEIKNVTPADHFNAPYTGTILFAANTSAPKTIELYVKQDNKEESDAKFHVNFITINAASSVNNNPLKYTINDDDMYRIIWIDYAPRLYFKKMSSGIPSEAGRDTMYVKFQVTEAALSQPTVNITLPPGVTPDITFLKNIHDENDIMDVKYKSWTASTRTLVYELNSATELKPGQKVHFKITRYAECSAAPGAYNDVVKVKTKFGANEYLVSDATVKNSQKTSWDVAHNIYKGKLGLTITEGDQLVYVNEGELKTQKLKLTNIGQGDIKKSTIRLTFPLKIVGMTSLKVNGQTVTPPVRNDGTTSYYDLVISGTGFGADQILTPGESIIIEYVLQGALKGDVGCGLKTENIAAWWGCSSASSPDATAKAVIELYRPKGTPGLIRTFIPQKPLAESVAGLVNTHRMTLENTGQSDAYKVTVPVTIGSVKLDVMSAVRVYVDNILQTLGSDYTLTLTPSIANIGMLYIPAGKTARIEYDVKRITLNRLGGSGNVINEDYFFHIAGGTITYEDECGENKKTITAGYFTADALGNANVGHLPNITPKHFDLLLAKQTNTYQFEFQSINTIFPMAESMGFFGANNSTDKALIINLNLGTNNFLPQSITLEDGNGNLCPATFVKASWTSGNGAKNESNLPVTAAADAGINGIYTVTLSSNAAQYFRNSAKFKFRVQAEDCTAGGIYNVSYTVSFKTAAGEIHQLYRVSGQTAIKCANEAGVNLKDWNTDPNADSRMINFYRANRTLADQDNNGEDNDTRRPTGNDTAKMRLDRFYHGDTVEFVYKLRIMGDPRDGACASNLTPWTRLYVTMDKMKQSRFKFMRADWVIYDAPENNPGIIRAQGPAARQFITATDSVYFQIMPPGGIKFEDKDSVVFRSRWIVTAQEPAAPGNFRRIEESHLINHWLYCWQTLRAEADIFRKLADADFCSPTAVPDYGLKQNYERGTTSLIVYSLSAATNGLLGGGGGYPFTQYYTSQPGGVQYDYFEVVGAHASTGLDLFPYELRQAHYIDSIHFRLPYGYIIVGNNDIQLFGDDNIDRMKYSVSGNPYFGFTGGTTGLQGFKQSVKLTGWHTDPYSKSLAGSFPPADESWRSRPGINIQLTPKAPYGEYIAYMRIKYKSNVPGIIEDMWLDKTVGFKLNNGAPTFILTCMPDTVQAMGDTVVWTVRVENKNNTLTAKNGWIYLGNLREQYNGGTGPFITDIKALDLTENGVKVPGSDAVGSGTGNKRWIRVGDLPPATTKIFKYRAAVTNWAGHCIMDSLYLAPWFDYNGNGDIPITSAALDSMEAHVGLTDKIYVAHQPSHLAGTVTSLNDTPKEPSAPGGPTFASDQIQAGTPFPVEIKLSSTDIIAVKDIRVNLVLPVGMTYVPLSAYYETGGSNQSFHQTGEDKMFNDIDGSGTPFVLTMADVTGNSGFRLDGLMQTNQTKRDIYLRFKLTTDCTFNADSAVISARIDGNHLCGVSAVHNNDPDTIQGHRIYLEGYRYYTLSDAIYGPNGYTFAVDCGVGKKKQTLRGSFIRQGRTLQNDRFELKMPKYFSLDPDVPATNNIIYGFYDPNNPGATPPVTINTSEDPINVIKVFDGDTVIYRWKLPVTYSGKTSQNLLVEYEIPVILKDDALGIKYENPFVLNIVADKTNQCSGQGGLLATDTLTVMVYINEAGLAKKVSKVLNPDQYYTITYTYKIVNRGNVPLYNVTLTDDLAGMFGGMVDFKPGSFAIQPDGLDPNPGYVGSGAVVFSGTINAGGTKTVILTFKARPNKTYDGRIFMNNAELTASNSQNCDAGDMSNDGDDPGAPPANFATLTPIQFNSLRFKETSPVKATENIGKVTYTIERVGDKSPYGFDFLLASKSGLAAYAPMSFYNEAKIGTSEAGCTDVWRNPLREKLTFAQDQTEITVDANIVDDLIDEIPLANNISEAFAVIITNVSLPDVALFNDTLITEIQDNDFLPSLSIRAVNDSIREQTDIFGPGHNYGTTDAEFKVSLSHPTVNYAGIAGALQTVNGAGFAVGGTIGKPGFDFDYYSQAYTPIAAFTLACAASDTVQTLVVKAVADSIPEFAEKMKISLIGISGIIPGTLDTYTTIVDDDIKIDTIKLQNPPCKGDANGEIVIKARGGETGISGGKYKYSWSGPGGFSQYDYTSANDTVKNLPAGSYSVTVTDIWSRPTSVTFVIEIKEPNNPLTIQIDDIKSVSCNGKNDGHINTSVSGGWNIVQPYDIAWIKNEDASYAASVDDIANLTAGLYQITVKDSLMCIVKDSVEITEPLPIRLADSTIHQITCKGQNDGSISITPEGGNPPYFIFWAGNGGFTGTDVETISGLSPDTYRLTIADSKGCPQYKTTFEIKEPNEEMTASVDGITNVACKGDASGAIALNVEGGWGKYIYAWSDGPILYENMRNNMIAGVYAVIVTDSAGCAKAISSITVLEPDEKMTVALVKTDETYQNGNNGTITVSVIGGVPAYTYSWSDGPNMNTDFRNFLQAGAYTVEVKDQWNCVITESVVIEEPKTVDNMPTAFTPDGDGFNDELLETYHIKVFDRWGLLLYEGRDGWDGRYKGKMMPGGTYFYVLLDEATGKEYKSSVLLQILK